MYVSKGEKLCVRRMNNIKRLRNKMENKKGGDMKIKSVCAFLVLGLFIFMASMSNSRLAFSVETEKTKTEILPAEQELAKAKEELLKAATPRQEARLVQMGIID